MFKWFHFTQFIDIQFGSSINLFKRSENCRKNTFTQYNMSVCWNKMGWLKQSVQRFFFRTLTLSLSPLDLIISNSMEEDIKSRLRWKSNFKKLNLTFHITMMLSKCTTFKTWHNIDVCRRYVLGKSHTYKSSLERKSHIEGMPHFVFGKKSVFLLNRKVFVRSRSDFCFSSFGWETQQKDTTSLIHERTKSSIRFTFIGREFVFLSQHLLGCWAPGAL